MSAPAAETHGALVISLDFELHWGVRDVQRPDGPYREHLLGARRAVPALLDLFQAYDVAATWATVGFLFARSREELERHAPAVRPAYRDPALSPYGEALGDGEADDPLHFAPTLTRRIAATPRQELGTHTFSHFCCLEPGATAAAFAADLAAAAAIMAAQGEPPASIVFPRNQHNPEYDPILLRHGIRCYRGNARGWAYAAAPRAASRRRDRRLVRLVDAHLPLSGQQTWRWSELPCASGLVNVPASFFLRPAGPGGDWGRAARRRRIGNALRFAAREGRMVHLWWHPHNFGVRLEENLAALRELLDVFAACRQEWGMRSLSMAGAADVALAAMGRT